MIAHERLADIERTRERHSSENTKRKSRQRQQLLRLHKCLLLSDNNKVDVPHPCISAIHMHAPTIDVVAAAFVLVASGSFSITSPFTSYKMRFRKKKRDLPGPAPMAVQMLDAEGGRIAHAGDSE
jgi:hypothetical protein